MAAVVLLSVSCSDVLDKAPDGRTSMEEILKNPDNVDALFNTCYGYTDPTTGVQYIIHGKGFHYWWWEPRASCTDEAYSSDEANPGVMVNLYYKDANTATSHSLDGGYLENTTWVRYFILIKQCTQFIGFMNDPDVAVSDPEKRAAMKAEAHLLRAFYYMELLKWYGGLPIFNAVVGMEADFSQLKRGTPYEVAQFIVADCDEALSSPSLPWRITSSSGAGRMTKAVAMALKSEAMLFAASPLFNGGANYWEEAYQQSKEAVEALKSNGYALFTQCTEPDVFGTGAAAAYRQLACRTADYAAAPRDRETIYQVGGDPYDWAGHIWHIGFIGASMPTTYKCGPGPTQEFVDAFETIDGKPILNLSQPYADEFHLQPNYNSANTMYNPNDPYKNRDPRFYECVVYNGSHIKWQGVNEHENEIVDWEVETYVGGRHEIDLTTTNYRNTRTGYYASKMVIPGSCALNDQMNARFKYYRLAETLLNLAEAAAEAGHTAEALTAVNEVRARSGMPAISGVSGEELVLRIRNERRVELAWEEFRYFDLRRWQRPSGDLSQTCKYFTCMWITKNGDGTFNYERRNISQSPRGGWQMRDLLLPIPQADAALLSSYTNVDWQNPGW